MANLGNPFDSQHARDRIHFKFEREKLEKERESRQFDFEWKDGQKDSRTRLPPKWHSGPYKMGYDSAGGWRPVDDPFRKRTS